MEEKEALLDVAQDPYAHQRKGNWEKWDELKLFFYNPNTKEYCEKTLREWWHMCIFAFWFYGFLLSFFVVLMALYLCTVDEIKVRERDVGLVLQEDPGMAMRPVPDFESPLIRFIQGREESYYPYVAHIEAFMDQYEYYNQDGENFIDCNQYSEELHKPDHERMKVCRFQITDLGSACQKQTTYGFEEGRPCILFKLNKVFDWIHEPYDEDDIPDEMKGRYAPTHVGVSCEGENEADIENIGNITYYPPEGFPGVFYPFLGQEDFRSPVMFAHFENPTNGMLLNIKCKMWAKNIKHDVNTQRGLIRFALMVD